MKRFGVALVMAACATSVAAHSVDGARDRSPLAARTEAARLEQMGAVRTNRVAVERCLAAAAAKQSAAVPDAAHAVLAQCAARLQDYATSLLALAPEPDFTQVPALLQRWEPYYLGEIGAQLKAQAASAVAL